jgi:hypothetical protein
MFVRPALLAMLVAALLLPIRHASAQSTDELFRKAARQPNDLARRQYLAEEASRLSDPDRAFIRQLLAGADNELGLYDRALCDFPFVISPPLEQLLPKPHQGLLTNSLYAASFLSKDKVANVVDAAHAITNLAATQRIVMVNEAHHDAHDHVLVLTLLPRLRKLGYNYFAAEALVEDGASLSRRGYPVTTSGTEYLHEPLYGEIIREAIRLGYTLVAYDPTGPTTDRDADQALNLYKRVFAKDPKARLFVLAGYAHIDKAKGELGNYMPMAMRLQQLTGLPSLSVDQTRFREVCPPQRNGVYPWMVSVYQPRAPIVLQQLGGTSLWSADPKLYDASVILPPPHGGKRPDWLTLDGQRRSLRIDTALCAGKIPCVVEAHYANEPDNAIAADRYTFLAPKETSHLYLFPGRYRLDAWDIDGKTLGEHSVTVP